MLFASYGNALAYESPVHVFTINDVMGGFDGSTYGTDPSGYNGSTFICGVPDETSIACPDGYGPVVDKQGVTLYPVDSEFGFYVVDFLGAEGKARDGLYEEGFVGNIFDGDTPIGIKVANAPTLKYKVKPPLGTWCQGLGGTSVKCETEHYVTMEHVLSCHETIPYAFADPVWGTQATLSTPSGSLTFNCDDAPLDDNTIIRVGGELIGGRLTDATPCESDGSPSGCQMFPNDKTDMLNNIALSSDYSVQLKDDGKPLYGWGGTHKRPNDVRMYARLPLPDVWKERENGELVNDFIVTRAELVVNHWITNNPNDQLRPEDLENEAATGRKPSYRIEGTIGGPDEVWKSTIPCYEGDGDLIDTEEGANDPTFLDVGTYLKNTPFALDPAATPGAEPADDPYAFSSDLVGGFTNAYYTTINRDPFEWSYVSTAGAEAGVYDFVGHEEPLSMEEMTNLGLELVSGPRWRLKPNKFGQDLPGLEIPRIECSAPPFKSDNIKYEVGTPVTTVINLLDWEDENSPLATSKGWVDVTANEFVTIADYLEDGTPITSNGLPMTEDFDLAVYVKGDAKSTAIFNAQLIIEYEGEPTLTGADLALGLTVPSKILVDTTGHPITLTVTNLGPEDLDGGAVVELTGVANKGSIYDYSFEIQDLPAETTFTFEDSFDAPTDGSAVIVWTATVTSGDDYNPLNDSAEATTVIKKK
jgi:hypothetical protein